MREPWTRKDTRVVAQYAAVAAAIGVAVYMWPQQALVLFLVTVLPLGFLTLFVVTGAGPRVRNGSKRA